MALLDMQRANEAREQLKSEDLKHRTASLLKILTDYLLKDEAGKTKFERMLDETKVKDISVVFGILTEKLLRTQGQPTTIMAHQEQRTADELFNAVMQEAKRRGLVKRPIEVVGVSSTPQS